MIVVQFLLAVPRVCLQFVIVVFPDHTHLLFLVIEHIEIAFVRHCLFFCPSQLIAFVQVYNIYILSYFTSTVQKNLTCVKRPLKKRKVVFKAKKL